MSMPSDAPIIDLMLSLPLLDLESTYGNLRAAAKDSESKDFKFPAEYMFKGVPHGWGEGRDPVEVTLEEMDKWGVERAMIGGASDDHLRALSQHTDRFFASCQVDPNRGMDAVYDLVSAYEKYKSKGFTIIGISLDKPDAEKKIQAVAERFGMNWEQIYDGGYWDAKLAKANGIRGIPSAFLIDRAGKVRFSGRIGGQAVAAST